MAQRGDIYSPFYGRSKEYVWSTMLRLAPRKITPTDIDFMVESSNHFAFFEMKTEGTEMPYGQRLALIRLLHQLQGKSVLFVCEHESLTKVTLPDDIVRFELWHSKGFGKPVARVAYTGDMLAGMFAAFFQWAAGHKTAFKEVLSEKEQ